MWIPLRHSQKVAIRRTACQCSEPDVRVISTPEAEQDGGDIWDYIAADNPHAAAGMDELFSNAQRRSAQRFQAQHDHLDFLDDFFLPKHVALPKQLSGVLLDAPHRVVHVLHATLVLRHQRTIEKLVQHGK